MSALPPTGESLPLARRPPLPASERIALRRLGSLVGAVVGVSIGLAGGVVVAAVIIRGMVALLGIVIAPLVALGLFSIAPDPYEALPPWALVALAASVVLALAALVVGWLRLSHWPRGRAAGVTLAAAALAGIPAQAANLGIVPLVVFVLEQELSIEAAHAWAVAASALAGAATGALAGRYAWAWIGHAMRPRWWRADASAPHRPLM